MATGYRQTDERIPEWLRDDLRRAGRTIEPYVGSVGGTPRRSLRYTRAQASSAKALKTCSLCGSPGHTRRKCARLTPAGVVVS